MKTVVSLCDLTGNMVQPWVSAGYNAVLVDPQHGATCVDGPVTKFAATVEDAADFIGYLIRCGDVAVVFGFPPCTDMAVSGARWFKDKYAADPLFQAKAVMVAEQCRTIGRLSGAPWMVENPVSVLSSAFGKPGHTFSPCDYTAWEPADNYTKKTCLWTGGGGSCRNLLKTPRWVHRTTGFILPVQGPSVPTFAAPHLWDSRGRFLTQTIMGVWSWPRDGGGGPATPSRTPPNRRHPSRNPTRPTRKNRSTTKDEVMARITIPHDGSIVLDIDPTNPKSWADIFYCKPGHEFVYTFRDERETVIYVGITWSAKARWDAHRSKKPWWPEVRTVELTCREKTQLALETEMSLIRSLHPKYNIRGAA